MSVSSTAEQARPAFDLFVPELIANPHDTYHRLRSADPVHWNPVLRAWVLTRHEDIRTVLNEKAFEAATPVERVAEFARRAGRDYGALVKILRGMLFFKNGEAHARDRRTLTKVINRTPLRQLEEVIEQLAATYAAELSIRKHYDAVGDFAELLPYSVMARILGIPASDVPFLTECMSEITLAFDLVTPRIYDRLNLRAEAVLTFAAGRVADAVRDDPGSVMACIYDATPGTGEAKLLDATAEVLFVFRVGAETTSSLIGLIINTMIEQPALYRKARQDLSLAPAIVSEVLRLESMVQWSVRVCRERRVVGGQTIRPGELIVLLLGAGNRDPSAFADPDELRLQDRAGAAVTFGGGAHFCIGANIARLEGRIALEHFLRLPPVERAGEETWYPGRSIRRLTRLPVCVVERRAPGGSYA